MNQNVHQTYLVFEHPLVTYRPQAAEVASLVRGRSDSFGGTTVVYHASCAHLKTLADEILIKSDSLWCLFS